MICCILQRPLLYFNILERFDSFKNSEFISESTVAIKITIRHIFVMKSRYTAAILFHSEWLLRRHPWKARITQGQDYQLSRVPDQVLSAWAWILVFCSGVLVYPYTPQASNVTLDTSLRKMRYQDSHRAVLSFQGVLWVTNHIKCCGSWDGLYIGIGDFDTLSSLT